MKRWTLIKEMKVFAKFTETLLKHLLNGRSNTTNKKLWLKVNLLLSSSMLPSKRLNLKITMRIYRSISLSTSNLKSRSKLRKKSCTKKETLQNGTYLRILQKMCLKNLLQIRRWLCKSCCQEKRHMLKRSRHCVFTWWSDFLSSRRA